MGILDPFTTAANLSDCICAVLKSEDRGEDSWVGDCCVWPGASVPNLKCCDDGGQLSVVVLNGYPTESFPSQMTRPSNCGMHSWATIYEVKVTRCVPTKLNCDCNCKERAAARILGDLRAVLQGIECCFKADGEDDCAQHIVTSWRLLNNSGGCGGLVATVTAETDSICCPPPAE